MKLIIPALPINVAYYRANITNPKEPSNIKSGCRMFDAGYSILDDRHYRTSQNVLEYRESSIQYRLSYNLSSRKNNGGLEFTLPRIFAAQQHIPVADGLLTFRIDNIEKQIAGSITALAAVRLQSNFRARQNHTAKAAIDLLEL